MAADLRAAAMMLEVRAGQAAEEADAEKPQSSSDVRTIVFAIVLVALGAAGLWAARGFLVP
jgi:hypothetical protein